MKKLLLILLIPFFVSGCYDYQELNDLAIISGIAIDYGKDYEVTFEILNSEKDSDEKVYYVKANGKTISEAFTNACFKIHKEAYFAHIKAVLFSEEIARNYMQDVTDYILREPNIRNIFYPLVVLEGKARDILENEKKDDSTSEAIEKTLSNTKSMPSIAIPMDFETLMNRFVADKKDAYLNTIKKEREGFALSGLGLFQKYKLIDILNEEETFLFNLLKNTSDNTYMKMACPNKSDKTITIDLYHNRDTKISVLDDTLHIESHLKGSIVEDDCELDFRVAQNYEILSKEAEKEMKDKINRLLTKIQKSESDVLDIQNSYYIKERKELSHWYTLKKDVKTSIDINKNGLIFKVNPNE